MRTVRSPVGALQLYADASALIALYLPDHVHPSRLAGDPRAESPILARATDQLAEYFAGTRTRFDLPLAPRGTPFQLMCWRALLEIDYGATTSYGALAGAIRRPSASRAVGAANGRNPISIIIPCHRVIGATGELTGYGGGLPAKRWLLDHEARPATRSRRSR